MADLFLGEIGWETVVTIQMERTKGLNQGGAAGVEVEEGERRVIKGIFTY